MKLNTDGNKLHLQDETNTDYWDKHDSSELFLKGEKVSIEIIRPKAICTQCKSDRIRKRLIDLPVLEEAILFKKVIPGRASLNTIMVMSRKRG